MFETSPIVQNSVAPQEMRGVGSGVEDEQGGADDDRDCVFVLRPWLLLGWRPPINCCAVRGCSHRHD